MKWNNSIVNISPTSGMRLNQPHMGVFNNNEHIKLTNFKFILSFEMLQIAENFCQLRNRSDENYLHAELSFAILEENNLMISNDCRTMRTTITNNSSFVTTSNSLTFSRLHLFIQPTRRCAQFRLPNL